MNQYVTGTTIKKLREKMGLTQVDLASKLYISPKTISKWETGKGFPDITLLEALSKTLNVSLTELFSGEQITNTNVHANMLNSKIYICPICGNVIFSIGESVVSCHGIELIPEESENTKLDCQIIEDEIYINISSPMTKDDHISFIAGVGCDRIDFIKLYLEGPAEARLKIRGLKYIYYYSNRNGLFRYVYKKKKAF